MMVNILNKHYMSIYKKIILYCNYVTRNVFHICPIGNLSLVMSCQDTNHYSNLLSSLGMRPPCRYVQLALLQAQASCTGTPEDPSYRTQLYRYKMFFGRVH